MNRLLASSAAMALFFTLCASTCKDAVNDILPDISTDVVKTITVSESSKVLDNEVLVDPNTNADYKANRDKLKFVTISKIKFNVDAGSFTRDRRIDSSEILFKHSDSTYHSLGKIMNTRISQLVTAVDYPATTAALNDLATLALTTNNKIKFRYKFYADSAGIAFRGNVLIRMTLQYK
jgi:hypothetical protein